MVTLERTQLLELAGRYLDALAARDPGRLPLSPSVRFTENGQRLAVGQGLWGTATSRETQGGAAATASPGPQPPGGTPPSRQGQFFADPVSGQVACFTVVGEIGGPAILALRLREAGGAITEVETLVVRQNVGKLAFAYDPPAVLTPRPVYEEVVEPSQRSSREELARIANLYLDGITQDDATLIPVRDDVKRIENGVQTTLAPDSPREVRRMGVAEQIRKGFTRHIAGAVQRRVSVIDEERGMVLIHFFFDHPGNLENAGGVVPMGFPNYMVASEVFKVRAGQITNIEAVIDVYPYGISDGWH